jgi:ribosomal protein S18 acetylase RimI-like enzyme
MTTLTFRDATADDVPLIVAMYADDALGATRESTTEPLPDSYWRAFADIDGDPRQRLVVAEDAGVVVATLQLTFLQQLSHQGSERAQIEGVRVSSQQRGNGIGRALMTWAIEAARQRGCGIVQLTTNASRHEAHRFYESLGFTASHVGMKRVLGST